MGACPMPPAGFHVQGCARFDLLLHAFISVHLYEVMESGGNGSTIYTPLSGTPWLPYQVTKGMGKSPPGLGAPHISEDWFPLNLFT